MHIYHEGRILEIQRLDNGETIYVGEHTKGPEDGKHIAYSAYERDFRRRLEELRVPGNLMAAIACDDDC
jgi:hypothetical protein